MEELQILFDNNARWARENVARDPNYYLRMVKDQRPLYLWIGCSDSRVPANEIVGLDPGEIFVHRNVANLFLHTDFNCLSVLQYGIDFLEIKHVIVCGHYGCGGVGAAMGNRQLGLVDNWLRNIRDIYAQSREELDILSDERKRFDRLVELNVMQQVMNIGHTTIAQNAWARKQPLWIHGWVYEIGTGRIRNLNCSVSSLDQVENIYLTRRISGNFPPLR